MPNEINHLAAMTGTPPAIPRRRARTAAISVLCTCGDAPESLRLHDRLRGLSLGARASRAEPALPAGNPLGPAHRGAID